MKNKFFLFSFIFLGLMMLWSCIIYLPSPQDSSRPHEDPYYEEDYMERPSRYDTSYFYDTLAPYGVWINHSPYGYVWIPRVHRYGWRPYSHGNWFWTDYGWTWMSEWEWGWIPFHYGRWGWDSLLGWYWVPDTVWGPAWVTWRHSSLYIGWAPVPPGTRFIPGVGIREVIPGLSDNYWIFVEYPYFYRTQIYRNMLPIERNRTIIIDTVHKTNIVQQDRRVINLGVDRDSIQNRVERPIVKHIIKDTGSPTKTVVTVDELRVYRPTVVGNERARPKTVVEKENMRERLDRPEAENTDVVPSRISEPALKETQEREIEILRRSQEQELISVRRKVEEDKKKAATAAEKERIEKEAQGRIGTLQQKHKTEEEQIRQRHKKEETTVKKKVIKKKTD